jgi:hypothetical protein
MSRIFALGAILAFTCVVGYADSWTGKLLDADCIAQEINSTCAPTNTTTTFALQTPTATLTLDAQGNRKAAEALKATNNSADRSKEPNAPDHQVIAKVEGTLNGTEIKVESIEMR